MQAALPARHVFDYLDLILVECPSCRGRAEAKAVGAEWGARRVACTRCMAVRTIAPRGGTIRLSGVEILPGLKLWLQGQTRHGTLYAYNHEHLDYIASYTAASLRRVDYGGNGSITSRLPAWVKSAKNRAEILKIIEKMRRK